MEREENVLEVRHLSIRFGSIGVLRDLTFHVPSGTTLAILGPNGAGKTVLFKALIGAIPYEGDIRWKPGTRIGYVPQKLDLERDVPIMGVDFLRARAALARESDVNISRTLALVGASIDVAPAAHWDPVRRPVPAPSRSICARWEPERSTAGRANGRR
jgi:zinc transport system ATP-binding protein